jgi:hypothetical protein
VSSRDQWTQRVGGIIPRIDALRWWLATASLVALAACAVGDDQAEDPASTTAALRTTAAAVTTEAPAPTDAPTTLAPPTTASTTTTVAPSVPPSVPPTAVTLAPQVTASTVPSVRPAASRHAWPTTVSGRKVLDQFGDTYLMRIFSSWGMAQNLTNSEITEAASMPSTAPRTASGSRPIG